MAKQKEIDLLLNRIAREERVSELVTKDIYQSIFLTTKKIMQQPEAPKVKLSNLGTFYPNINKIDRILRFKFKRYREGKLSREQMVALVNQYWPIRRRIQQELSTSRPKTWI